MIGAPLLSPFTALDLMWISPPHNPKGLRALKHHLDNGGTIHVQRTTNASSMIATVIGRMNVSQPRTSELGLLLQVDVVLSSNPNDLEKAITLFRQVFVPRSDVDHPSVPTVHEYAIANKALAQASADLETVWHTGLISTVFYQIYSTLFSITKSSTYFLLQGGILKAMWVYPILQVPLAVGSIAIMMTYYNVSGWDLAVWFFSLLAEVFSRGSSVAIEHFGEPAGRYVSAVCEVYGLLLMVRLWASWRVIITSPFDIMQRLYRFSAVHLLNHLWLGWRYLPPTLV